MVRAAVRPSTFGIFDAFADEEARQAHLTGQVAGALKERAGEMTMPRASRAGLGERQRAVVAAGLW